MLNASAEVPHGARRWATDATEFDDDDFVYVGQHEPVAVDNPMRMTHTAKSRLPCLITAEICTIIWPKRQAAETNQIKLVLANNTVAKSVRPIQNFQQPE